MFERLHKSRVNISFWCLCSICQNHRFTWKVWYWSWAEPPVGNGTFTPPHWQWQVIWCKWSWVVLLCVKGGVFRNWVELSNKKIKVTLNVMAWLYWKHVKELRCWTKRCQTHLCNCSCTNEASSIATHIGDWKPGCICYQSNIQMFCLLCVRYVSSSVTHSYCNLNTSSWSKLSAACPSHVLMCFMK